MEFTTKEQEALGKIQLERIKIIYRELVASSKDLKNVDARQEKSGKKLSFRYYRYGIYHFSFIVNQNDLLFFVRKSALENRPSIIKELKQNDIRFEYNNKGEIKIRITDKKISDFIIKLLSDYYKQ